jgi:hypothetical protein
MLALTVLSACRVHAPARPCDEVMLGACVDPMVALTPCERGRARDLDDGACMSTRDTRNLARATGVFVDEQDTIECESKDDELVASARLGKIACLEREAPPPSCPARSVREGAGCAPLDRGGTVDLATWSRAAATEVCSRLRRSPAAIALPEARFEVELAVSVPNNDLSLGYVRAKADAGDLSRIDDALRRLGGTASASETTATAICRTTSRRPISVP